MTSVQEYDLEFKQDTIIKGKVLSKLIVENKTDKYSEWENEVEANLIDVCPIFTTPESWYIDLVYYLQQGYIPKQWNSK